MFVQKMFHGRKEPRLGTAVLSSYFITLLMQKILQSQTVPPLVPSSL